MRDLFRHLMTSSTSYLTSSQQHPQRHEALVHEPRSQTATAQQRYIGFKIASVFEINFL